MISPKPLAPRSTRVASRVSQHAHRVPASAHDTRIERQFRRLADNVMREFPVAAGGTLLFSGVSSSSHIAHVAEQVAQQLSQQANVRVALVDGDPDTPMLSKRLRIDGDVGLAEALQQQTSVASAMIATEIPNVDFLPFGDRGNGRTPIANSAVKSVLSDLHQLCRYTVIVSGTNTSPLCAMLSRHCDGMYLVVQLGMAGRQQTADLASHFTRAGARLLGCVATSVV